MLNSIRILKKENPASAGFFFVKVCPLSGKADIRHAPPISAQIADFLRLKRTYGQAMLTEIYIGDLLSHTAKNKSQEVYEQVMDTLREIDFMWHQDGF